MTGAKQIWTLLGFSECIVAFYGNFHQGVIQAFLMIWPGHRVSLTEEAKISGDLMNNMKDRLSPYLSEQKEKILHNKIIYFSCQMNKSKSKNSSLC